MRTLETMSTWQLCMELRERLSECPEQGRRAQLCNSLDMLVTLGGGWLLLSKGAPKEQEHV